MVPNTMGLRGCVSTGKETAGPSTTLRSGRDDNSVAGPSISRWNDCLGIITGAGRRPALLPQLFPIPDPGHHFVRQRESELMCEHTYLPAMVSFVSKHVTQHLRAGRPRLRPAVPVKLLSPTLSTAERFSEHLPAASGALGQS